MENPSSYYLVIEVIEYQHLCFSLNVVMEKIIGSINVHQIEDRQTDE
jgi:hypothetical protein